MKIGSPNFWRASLVFWIVAFLYVATMELLGHGFLHPVQALFPPIVMMMMSAVCLRRAIWKQNQKNSD
jgi:hypothetical protein